MDYSLNLWLICGIIPDYDGRLKPVANPFYVVSKARLRMTEKLLTIFKRSCVWYNGLYSSSGELQAPVSLQSTQLQDMSISAHGRRNVESWTNTEFRMISLVQVKVD